MKTLFKVINQSEPQTITKQDGSTTQKSTIVLQEVGGKYDNQYVATLLGNLAQCKFYEGDYVWASLHFVARKYQDAYYQDISVQGIVSFTTH